MTWDTLVQVIMGLIAIGSFVGQTKYAMGVFGKRLDTLEALCYSFDRRLAQIEGHLRGPLEQTNPDRQ